MRVRLDHESFQKMGSAMGESFGDTTLHKGEHGIELLPNDAKGFSYSADVRCHKCKARLRIGYRSRAQILIRYSVIAAMWIIFFILTTYWQQAQANANAAHADGSGYTVASIFAVCVAIFVSAFLYRKTRIKALDDKVPGEHKLVRLD